MLNSLLNQLNDMLTIYCNSYFIKKITINISKPHLYTLGCRKCPSIGHFILAIICKNLNSFCLLVFEKNIEKLNSVLYVQQLHK